MTSSSRVLNQPEEIEFRPSLPSSTFPRSTTIRNNSIFTETPGNPVLLLIPEVLLISPCFRSTPRRLPRGLHLDETRAVNTLPARHFIANHT